MTEKLFLAQIAITEQICHTNENISRALHNDSWQNYIRSDRNDR